MGNKFGPIAGVICPHMLRNKYFNRLPNQFSPFIAEQLINLPIHHTDGPLLIYHQQAVRGRFHHEAKLLLRMLALSEISYDRCQTGRLPVIPHHRKHRDGHRNLGAIFPKILDFIFDRLTGLEDLSHDVIPLFFVLFGNQIPHIHPEQLFSRETGQFRKRPIDEEDGPIDCGIADRVLRCFENIFKKYLQNVPQSGVS